MSPQLLRRLFVASTTHQVLSWTILVLLVQFIVLWLKMSLMMLAELNKNPVEGFSAGLIDDDDIYKWEVVIIGPQDTLL